MTTALSHLTPRLIIAVSLGLLVTACSSSGNNPDTDTNTAAVTTPGTPDNENSADTPEGAFAPPPPPGSSPEAPPPETSARYRATFNASWSEDTHATNFPGNPHFSGLVGAVHNEQVVFWEPGQIASEGVREVAETGGKVPMRQAVNEAIASGYAVSLIDGPGVPTSPGAATVEFEVNRDFPLITILSMLAPSPDWFVGVHNLSLISDGRFIDVSRLELELYDAGTDSGLRYTASNNSTEPRDTIALVTSDPADASFLDGRPLVGELVIEKIQGIN